MTYDGVDEATLTSFRTAVLDWGDTNRRSFFWREEELSLFEALIVEILLTRTRADSAEPVAKELVVRVDEPGDLAAIEEEELQVLLEPLGLHRKRAAALKKMGEDVCARFSGKVPDDYDALTTLPYVGRYAGNAALCFSRGLARPIVDANVARVLERVFGLPSPGGKLESEEKYWSLAGCLVPEDRPREYNWSLIDLGALICRPRSPACEECPLRDRCSYGRERLAVTPG